MKFRDATDSLCEKIDHEDIAKALSVSVQTIRQARLKDDAIAHRSPPEDWQKAIIRLAEKQVGHYRQLIEKLRTRGTAE